MSTQTIYEQETEYYYKKGKWKKCICSIQIISRMENTLCAIIKDHESISIIEVIDIFGYVCGVNGNEFVFIGKKENHSIRFKDITRMMELEKLLTKYIYDVSYFMKLEDSKNGDRDLIPHDWYRFHVQLHRICLTTYRHKVCELIKIWNIYQIGEIKLSDCSLIIEIQAIKDWAEYTFYHNHKKVLDKIYHALLERRRVNYKEPSTNENYFIKRKSETVDLKRFNSYSNTREMKANNRIRTLSSTETHSYDYGIDVSMPSTPAYGTINTFDANLSSRNNDNILENVESPLVFQMDSIDCGSVDSNGVYDSERRSKTNSEGYDSISIESDLKKKVDLERFPFEAEIKNKISANASSSSNLKDSNYQVDNGSIISRPNNGKFYQTLSNLKNHYKALSDANLVDNIKRLPNDSSSSNLNGNKAECQDIHSLFSENKCSSSSYLHTPSSSCNTSYDNKSVPLTNSSFLIPKYDNQSIPQRKSKCLISSGSVSNYIESGGHTFPSQNYYNLSSHFNNSQTNRNKSNNHRYYNLTNAIQSEPVDIKPQKEEERKLNYIQLDFADFSNPINTKLTPSHDHDNYKEIDIKNTEALKSLDGISFVKPQKKSVFRYLFKNK